MNCPQCSRRLERVDLRERTVHCCPACSLGWMPPGQQLNTVRSVASRRTAAINCPQCDGERLVMVGAAAGGDVLECMACGGHLIRLTVPAETPPPPTPKSDQLVAGLLTVFTYVVEFVAEIGLS